MAVDWVLLVTAERAEQDAKWGQQDHDDFRWLAILSEEVGELSKEMLEGGKHAVKELVQVIAVGVAWLEAIERRST